MEDIKTLCGSLGCGDAVLFLGERDDVPKLLQMMDLFVFPSFFEGFPISLIEAQAAGLPCLVSDSISKETLITGKIRRLSPEASELKWAQAMEDFSNYNYKPEHFETEYSLDTIADQVKTLYTEQIIPGKA